MNKRFLLIVPIMFAISSLGFFTNPYASRILPVKGVPASCSENSIAYDMTGHNLLICTNSGFHAVGAGGIGGSGTINTVAKFTASGSIGNSQIFDDGANISMTASSGTIDIVSGTEIDIDSKDTISLIGDVNGNGNSTLITVNDSGNAINLNAGSGGVNIVGGIQFSTGGNITGINGLAPFSNGVIIGSTGQPFSAYFLGNAAGNSIQLAGTFAGNRVATFPDQTGTVGLLLTNSATLDFGNLAAIGCEDLTITVTGAAIGDTVSLGVPNASIVANGNFSAWVSSSNTVSVRFCTFVSGNPASGSFKVDVWKH